MFLSGLRRNVGFQPQLKHWKLTYFRPARGKVEIIKSAGRVFPAQPETEMYTTVLKKHKLFEMGQLNVIIWM
jgi:hypothetical protein